MVAILLRLSFLGFRDTTHLVQYIRGLPMNKTETYQLKATENKNQLTQTRAHTHTHEVVVEQAPRYDRQVDHVLHYADVCDVAMLPISQRPYHKATDVNLPKLPRQLFSPDRGEPLTARTIPNAFAAPFLLSFFRSAASCFS